MLPITIESGTRVEWRAPGPQGIQGATGPTGMPSSLYDAKGDLIVGSANDTPTRLPVGNDGDLLVASSGATPGLAWRAPSPITASATGVTLNRAQPVVVNPAGGGAKTWTLPPAADNYGVQFTCINDDTATVTINRSGSDLIAGSLTTTSIPGQGTLRLISDGTGWRVLDGSYDTDTVGLASYEWRHSGTPGWRLIAYDSGLRNITTEWIAAHNASADASKFDWSSASFAVYLTRSLSHSTITILDGFKTAGVAGAPLIPAAIPSGFRPSTAYAAQVPIFNRNATTVGAIIQPWSNGSMAYVLTTSIVNNGFEITYPSPRAPLPSSLPGTQVTAPV